MAVRNVALAEVCAVVRDSVLLAGREINVGGRCLAPGESFENFFQKFAGGRGAQNFEEIWAA